MAGRYADHHPEGIAILWPPNAVLLSAFLLLPYRQWPWIAAAAMLAECIADVPAFPLWAAVVFDLVNLFETALAAWLIRRTVGPWFDFDRLRRGGYFLLYGPLLGSSLAARSAQGAIRPLDLFARFGGEEFVIMLFGANEANAVMVGERVRRAIATVRLDSQGEEIRPTVSIGVSQWDGRDSIDALISKADTALYRAKSAGRNCMQTASGR